MASALRLICSSHVPPDASGKTPITVGVFSCLGELTFEAKMSIFVNQITRLLMVLRPPWAAPPSPERIFLSAPFIPSGVVIGRRLRPGHRPLLPPNFSIIQYLPANRFVPVRSLFTTEITRVYGPLPKADASQ